MCTAHDCDLSFVILFSLAGTTVNSEIWRLVSNLPSVTNFGYLVLWKWSYGPWDHFMVSVKKWIRLGFYQSDSTFWRKAWFSSWLARCKVPSWGAWQKAFIFFEKGFYILEKGVYIFEKGRSAAIRRYLPLFDAIRCYSTLFDAIRRYSTLFDAIRHFSMLFSSFGCVKCSKIGSHDMQCKNINGDVPRGEH